MKNWFLTYCSSMPVFPDNDIERVTSLFVILSGCVVVTGAAVATLSLVISLYMSPEETFRSRYRLIIKEMVSGQALPLPYWNSMFLLLVKVQYRALPLSHTYIYWHSPCSRMTDVTALPWKFVFDLCHLPQAHMT